MLKGNNHLDNYAQITKKQNEKVNDYKTNLWQQRAGSSLRPSTQVNKDVKIRINNFKDLKNVTTLLIERQDGGGIRQQRDVPHASSSSSTPWQDSTWQWKSWWWHYSQYDEQ